MRKYISKLKLNLRLNRKTCLRAGIAIAGVVATVLITSGVVYLRQPPKVVYQLSNLKVNAPIEISFTRPVQDHVNYNISPSLQGTWKKSRNLLGVTSLAFYPSRTLTPGSTYKLVVGHIVPVAETGPAIITKIIPITVEKPAAVARVSPAAGATNVPVATAIKVTLAAPNHGLRQLRLQSDAPLKSAAPVSTDDTTFTWSLSQALPQGQTYHWALTDTKQRDKTKQVILTSTFTTVPEPQVVAATNRSHFYPGETVTVGFDQDMKPTDNDFKFNFGGSGHWQDARTYVFTPTGLAAGQSYSYSVLKGASSTHGGVVVADHGYAISPPGAVYVTGWSPGGGNVGVGSAISATFDQPVDHPSAQAAFATSPVTSGSFSWSGNTMTFHPAALGYQTGYTVGVAPGVKGTYGLPSAHGYSTSFSTTYQVIKLNVPYFHQAYAMSCEEAALRMALAFRGISVNDFDILQRVGYNPRPRDMGSNSWDNPYQMFVGDVNGQQGVTGWGVYGPPIAAAAQSFGRNATYINGISASQVADAIHNNNPVVLWGFNGSSIKPDSWNTTSGVVSAPRNEHTRTVYGVAGSAANPIGFYIHDPFNGDFYWTTAQMQFNMSFGGTQASQGVVVY